MAAVHLVDVTYLYDKHRFLASMTLALTAAIGLETPFLNMITKVDLLAKLGRPDMGLSFYEGVTSGLKFLYFNEIEAGKDKPPGEEDPTVSKLDKKYGKLTGALCELLENYQKVAFNLVDLTDRMSMTNAIMKIDKANSFFNQHERLNNPKETAIDYDAVE